MIWYIIYSTSSLDALTTDTHGTGDGLFGGKITNITIYNSKCFNAQWLCNCMKQDIQNDSMFDFDDEGANI